MAQDRHIKLGFILHGVGRTWDDWRHPDRDIRASTNIRFYRQQAQTAECRDLLAGRHRRQFQPGRPTIPP
ncbi:hypothetical protein [Gluconacetobacter asukensis]|uniref:hypothetical protein n=1 Tax=Gluconacetobacter asukensis TaxID=1017181 RepID=UPI001FECB846